MQALFADQIFRSAAVRAVADEDEFGGHFGADQGEDFDYIGEALDGAEIREVHEDGLAVGGPFLAEGGLRFTRIEIAIHEIGDDFDGALDVELFDGLVEKILRDGGDAVALFDGKFGNGQITAIAANESDVGAMKRGDKRQAAGSGHGTREEGADGMGDGVVHVEEIERFGLENFEHLGGKSERVRRVVEKRVAGDFDFVEMDVRIIGVHADRRGVADEVDVVAARGKLLAKLGGDDAGAAVCWVTSDADFHRRGSPVSSVVSLGQIVQHSTGKQRPCGA